MITALAARNVETIADLQREFNHQNDVTVAYKAFYNRLARPGFAKFMHAMLTRLVEQLSIQTLKPEGHTALSRFKDIVIQDGSSFALKKTLRDVFPGRFTTVGRVTCHVQRLLRRGRLRPDCTRQGGRAAVSSRCPDLEGLPTARRSWISGS